MSADLREKTGAHLFSNNTSTTNFSQHCCTQQLEITLCSVQLHPRGCRIPADSTFLRGPLSTQMGREIPNPPGTSRAGISTACFAVLKQTRSCCWAVCEPSIAQSSQSSVPRASPLAGNSKPSSELLLTSAQARDVSRENQESTRATEV